MIQILTTKSKYYKKKYLFIIQLIFSILIFSIIIYSIFNYFHKIYIQEKISKQIINNYNLSSLYANIQTNKSNNTLNDTIFCNIEIPKIKITYPVFSNLNEELLKIGPCKFHGNALYDSGNICIAAHNYDNGKFFSNLNILDINDYIFLYSNNKEKYTYIVTSKYEVNANDLSPIFENDYTNKYLTLITCNNFNGNRIVVKSIQKQSQSH